ncbi:MAG: M20/M25/M40 family metallo-hydrolase [Myxococcales bacterium]|nr:M20/M25/M40 family metallo-hydrolase [Myxococcales bacterium]
MLDPDEALKLSRHVWDTDIVPRLKDYIVIPNKSPAFDKQWAEHGHMERAVTLLSQWCAAQPIPGLKVEVIRLNDDHGRPRTPVIMMEVPGTGGPEGDTVLLYGHLDKQPEMAGWRQDLAPWEPVLEGIRLFGRGGADDGYAAFASLTAIRMLQDQGLAHARCVILIEADEESGSPNLPSYIEHLAERIGKPSLVVCLDSGCANYDQLWITTSLRGLVGGTLKVEVLREGVHSGDASGIVPSTFRIVRQLLSRIEDESTGELRVEALKRVIPEAREAQAEAAARVLGDQVWRKFPWVDGAMPLGMRDAERVLRRTWKPTLSVTGVEGMPSLENAGNVLRPYTALKLSVRIPPGVDPVAATAALKGVLEEAPPSGARVKFEVEKGAVGWDAPPFASWLEDAAHAASKTYFGAPAMAMGEGGTIPFMGMLGARFPEAQFLITGLLGPGSNAHGPNEFLHVPTGQRLTAAVADVLEKHALRGEK